MSDKTIYALCFRGTTDTVMVEQGLFYGQPTKSSTPTFMERDEVNRLLNNEAFLKNLLGGCLEIREVSVVFGSPITLRLLPPEQQAPRYQLPELSSTIPIGKAPPHA